MHALLEKNYPYEVTVLINRLGWKHGPIADFRHWMSENQHNGLDDMTLGTAVLDRDVRAAFMTKNPLAWVMSYLRHLNLQGQINRNFTLINNLAHTYASINTHWREQAGLIFNHFVFVTHEQLLESFQPSMMKIAEHLGLPGKDSFQNVSKVAKPSDDAQGVRLGKNDFPRRAYYETRQYEQEISDKVKRVILAPISEQLLNTLGYGHLMKWKK